MRSSPACFAAFNRVLAAEYELPRLRQVNRLTVDTWAVQHPGPHDDPRAVQSTGLHLARLMLQIEQPRPPRETNAVMLDFARHKSTLEYLTPPNEFTATVADVVTSAATADHVDLVHLWAAATWKDWTTAHRYIRAWVAAYSIHA
jgi:hypothetical protein